MENIQPIYAVKAFDQKVEIISLTDRILKQNQQILSMNKDILKYITQISVEVTIPHANNAEMTEYNCI